MLGQQTSLAAHDGRDMSSDTGPLLPALLLACAVLVCTSPCRAATIDTLAGTGHPANNGDTGSAQEVNIRDPFGVEFGPGGALYVTEVGHHRVRRVNLATGRISTVAGCGTRGYSGDGGPARQAHLNEPYEVRFDGQGHMYFVEMMNHVVRRVDAQTGTIHTVAGNGKAGFAGDGGPARQAEFNRPHSIALDQQGGLYIADIGNHRIRRVDLETGIVTTIAGTGEKLPPVDGQRATQNPVLGPRALAVRGRMLWVALREGNSVWRMNLETRTWEHIAGTGEAGLRDGPGHTAMFRGPKGIAIDAHGHAYVVDTENHVIRKIDSRTRNVSTVAGSGRRGAAGDGGPARQAEMDRPHGICVGPTNSLYIGDTLNHRVRVVNMAAKKPNG